MASPPTQSSPLLLQIHLHSTLSASHSTHGISQEDYAQYSAYCTRRLSRLRHAKDVKRDLLHCRLYKGSLSTAVVAAHSTDNAGGASGSGGGGKGSKHAYRPIDLTNLPSSTLASHINYFLEPLFCAERCWASSMHFKSLISGSNASGTSSGGGLNLGGAKKEMSPGKLRAQSIKRLRKAVKYAALVETLTMTTYAGPKEETKDGDANDNEGKILGEETQSPPPVDEHTQMEAKAYASWMRGNLALEQNSWQVACKEYQMALTLCQTLANSHSSQNQGQESSLELFDFFTTRAQHVIAPLLKYCHYELQEKGMSPDEKISFLQDSSSSHDSSSDPLQSKLHSLKTETIQSQATSGTSMSQITFRENNIMVETKELRMALLKIQDLREDWEEQKNDNNNKKDSSNNNDSKLMALLSGYDDILSLSNQELKQLSSLKSGPAVNAKKFQLVNISGYVKFHKLKLLMARNEGLVTDVLKKSHGSKKRNKKELTLKQLEEVAHLYDALLQDARAVASLPGGGSPEDYFDNDATGSGGAVVVEDEFLMEANANILRLRALRCYYLGKMHASPLICKYPQAVALLEQAESLANEALEEIGACEQMEGGEGMMEMLKGIVEEMKGEKCRVLAVSYLSKTMGSSSSSSGNKMLLQRLGDYNVPFNPAASIANVPPKLEPMACKPSFFDVAFNYVSEYPIQELESAMEEVMGKKDAGVASTGILGWFRRG